MSGGNAGARVGALLRRSVVDQTVLRQTSSLRPFELRAAFRTPPLLARKTTPSYIATNPRTFFTSTASIPPFARSFTTGSFSAPLHRPHAPQVTSAHESVTFAVASAWARSSHSSAPNQVKKTFELHRRYKSSSTNDGPSKKQPSSAPQAELSPQPNAPPKSQEPTPKPESESSVDKTKHVFGRLPQSLPHLYRPSKQELLDAASGFFSRLKVHFKWFTIRSARPYTVDEIYALISWILAAHILWIVIGTTTFFSLLVFVINSVFAQETVAKWIGNYLTKSSGLEVVFESAVVPRWKDGTISFKKVFVSRRPGQGRAKVRKGSQISAAAAAAAIAQKEKDEADGVVAEEEDTNYTQFDISMDTVNVTLSFNKWWNGKGILRDVEIKGIRGVVDRTSVHALAEYVDPRTYKHEHNPGDFELDSFKMEDLLVTIYQPHGFRPYSVSIFQCDLPRLRKQWLFYDFISANHMSGSFDNSLFNIHPRQTHNFTGTQLAEGRDTEQGTSWKKQSRIRVDGLNIDHLNRGYEGPFSWIYEGNVDIVADVGIPSEDDGSLAKVMSDFYDRVEATVTQNGHKHYSDHAHGFDASQTEEIHPHEEQTVKKEQDRFVVMDVRVHLNDVRAAVPIFTKDISYINNALVRPIVAYINSRRTFIPVNCRVIKPVTDFDGSWTIFDSGLMDDLSQEMYDAFARDVLNDNSARKRRIKKVGIWTLQLAAQALFLGLAGNIA
ncbi:hypothetical protein BDV96DRAFT_586277 [Lophiotrema nucula]|uniref:Mitochondrial distribution and morphology protein-domain-containing protein n=1 Tax=Lophiotrema nucula TaxID=690887 RepID=A0A6A5YPB3_9PLEO|nr:hypothetical protein BDV96DRAFT_586277 [Lophiotrema nucula]